MGDERGQVQENSGRREAMRQELDETRLPKDSNRRLRWWALITSPESETQWEVWASKSQIMLG